MRAKFKLVIIVIVILNLCCLCDAQKRNKKGTRLLMVDPLDGSTGSFGLWPGVFNVAKKATITSNATCGDLGKEEYCRLGEQHRSRPKARAPACGICDPSSTDPDKHHPPSRVLDGTARWWQSPSLRHGDKYHRVTLTLDLGQIYQIAYVIVRAANSPRPAAWVLERSLDGIEYLPWQFFASSDEECWRRYGLEATPGKPRHRADSEVICTAYYSKIQPLENGEIHVSLLSDKPQGASPLAENFAMARYVRLRFQRMRTLSAGKWLRRASDRPKGNTHYYSIREIDIGGQCVCGGHASRCRHDVTTGHPVCECMHNTCGAHCDQCCPMYNQLPYRPGTINEANACERCECHGHAMSCIYDQQIDELSGSMDINGEMRGGGVCMSCTKNTTGINCERCLPGFYRPLGVLPNDEIPCLPCDCDEIGSTGICGIDRTSPNNCECKSGFAGARCDRCAPGHRGVDCHPCPCDIRGSLRGSECEIDCQCKKNVEGIHCDTCKTGYFALSESNIDGCISCFCSGVGSSCRSANVSSNMIFTLDDWQIADEAVASTVTPIINEDTGDLIAVDEELVGLEPYYWNAPSIYLGNLLTSYGTNMIAQLSWLIMRGDTSGRVTTGPDAIIIGMNGQSIQYGSSHHDGENVTLFIPLREQYWHKHDKELITRAEFMTILTNVKHILIRAKFHTDQAECIIKQFTLHSGNNNTKVDNIGLIERCDCAPGYAGLSCEKCSYGHVRAVHGRCERCDCNNHSQSCDPNTGACDLCEHNTAGEKCERCAPGYYGNPLNGTADDCKKCACPLLDPTNNFSPSCQQDGIGGYVCTQCPEGYIGDHCEICDDGYYGSPLVTGSTCELCDCGPDKPCDPISGECLDCGPGTTGRLCDRCEPGSFGDPSSNVSCLPCSCYENGTVLAIPENDEILCNTITGQCDCNERFTGRDCDICQVGYGDISKDCPPCSCDSLGSVNGNCDPITGECDCKPGVGGRSCDTCLELHYGFGESGCQGCMCSKIGSIKEQCDIVSGNCMCKKYVIGSKCDSCDLGYWGIRSGQGCESCHCNPMGSMDGSCDQYTGQCLCKPSVTGLHCDSCAPGYYGFTEKGCSLCEPCDKPGHICDPDTGRCICPRLSTGPECMKCLEGAWNPQPGRGCSECKCFVAGSLSSQCDQKTGQCQCKPGYTGKRCEKCADYYYGFPYCKKCQCDMAGTDPNNCNASIGQCSCTPRGQCLCKSSTDGEKCDTCLAGSFGLNPSNPNGCTSCFCFGRTSSCSQADLTWGQTRLISEIALKIDHLRSAFDANHQMEYVEILTEDNKIDKSLLKLPAVNGLFFIPNRTIALGTNFEFHHPIYFQLPQKFLGDKILSYGGTLKCEVVVRNTTNKMKRLDKYLSSKYPLAFLVGHNELKLEYFDETAYDKENFTIQMHESYWRVHKNPDKSVSRQLFMVALQKVTLFMVRATTYRDFDEIRLKEASLDTAILVPDPPKLGNPAFGIEKCNCPEKYAGTSCQNPAIGYHRHKNSDPEASLVSKYVGNAKKCYCSGRSTTCDSETGHCTNCGLNTTGSQCQLCAEGFFGNPDQEGCAACQCPDENRNHARFCKIARHHDLECICKKGYTGKKCDKCDKGYFGNPLEMGGECKKCDCEPSGSRISECDSITGECRCKDGLTGPRCDTCVTPRHEFVNDTCQPCDNCTQVLLNDIDSLLSTLESGTNHTSQQVPPPWPMLEDFINRTNILKDKLYDFNNASNYLIFNGDYWYKDFEKDILESIQQAKYGFTKIEIIAKDSEKLKDDAIEFWDIELKPSIDDMNVIIKNLQHIMVSNSTVDSTKALEEARNALEFIQQISFIDLKESVQNSYNESEGLLSIIKHMSPIWSEGKNNIASFNTAFNATNIKIEQFRLFIQKIKEVENKVYQKLEHVRKTLDSFNKKTFEIDRKFSELDSLPTFINITLDEYSTRLDLWNDEWSEIKYELERRDQIMRRLGPKYEEDYVETSMRHALKLQEYAEQLKDKFNISEKAHRAVDASTAYKRIVEGISEAKLNLEFANKSIIKTNLALKNFTNLINASFNIQKESEGLNAEAAILDKIVLSLRNQIMETNNLKDNLTSINVTLKELNNALKNKNRSNIDSFEKEILEATNAASFDKVDIDDIFNSTQNMKQKIKSFGEIAVDSGNFGENAVNSGIMNKIKEANTSALKIEVITKLYESKIQSWNINQSQLSEKFESLRNQIDLARQISEEIAVSLTNNITQSDEPCQREYAPLFLASSSSNLIEFKISVPRNISYSGLIYILGINNDFIAIELVERNIKITWDLGGGPTEIVSSLVLNENVDDTEDGWYKVAAERVSNFITLSVQGHSGRLHALNRTSDEKYLILDLPENSARLWVGGFPIELLGNYKLNDSQIPTKIGLQVRLDQLKLDNTPVGLWNFINVNNSKCEASQVGSVEKCASNFYFNGYGYSNPHLTKSSSGFSRMNRFTVALNLITLDSNALLFLADERKNNRLIALMLDNGYVVFEIRYGAGNVIRIKSDSKVNNGTAVRIDGVRIYNSENGSETAILKLNGQSSRDYHPTSPIASDTVPMIDESDLYYGGIPPHFKKLSGNDIINQSLLGNIDTVQINGISIDLSSNIFYGVEIVCDSQMKEITSLGFHGNGYLELEPMSLLKSANIKFGFRTNKSNASLLLNIAYADSEISMDDLQKDLKIKGFYSVSLSGGKAVLNINTNLSEINSKNNQLITNGTFNDGKFHVVHISKSERNFKLFIDDSLQAEGILNKNQKKNLNVKTNGSMYFGGVPLELKTIIQQNLQIELEPVVGAIKEVFINDRKLIFNKPLKYENVSIGRLGPNFHTQIDEQNTQPAIRTFTELTQSCTKMRGYSVEKDSAQFGDGGDSCAEVLLPQKNIWQKEYSIEFDFRTFYPNGMLFAVLPIKPNHRHHLILSLENGQLSLQVRGKQRRSSLQLPVTRLNDGKWHHVKLLISAPRTGGRSSRSSQEGGISQHSEFSNSSLNLEGDSRVIKVVEGPYTDLRQKREAMEYSQKQKNKKKSNENRRRKKEENASDDKKGSRKATLSVDGNNSAQATLAGKINVAPILYVGGLPDRDTLPKNMAKQLRGLKGCVRSFKVNDQNIDLVASGKIRNVRQCFPNVERGSYFAGDSYAIYDEEFVMNNVLELQLDFRTSTTSGVLLSAADRSGKPAISLEINNGKIIMSVDSGNGFPLVLERELPMLCDNRWHNISALYDSEQLSIRVDQLLPWSRVRAPPGHDMPIFKGPLYIGGLPDNATTGSLITRDNFNGCIRNVKLGAKLKDWTDMESLHNVLLGSCPVED